MQIVRLFGAVCAGLLCTAGFAAAAGNKGLIDGSYFVSVTNDFERPMTGATVTLTAGSTVLTTTENLDGVYAFAAIEDGDYTLQVSDRFFSTTSESVSITNLSKETVVVLMTDDAQFPVELLNDFRNFDTDMNGEVAEAEFAAEFADARDAYLTYRDGCNCALNIREVAVLARQPFLAVSPTKTVADAAFPAGFVDAGQLILDTTETVQITVSNDGGGPLAGSVEAESHGRVTIDLSPSNYTLNPNQAVDLDIMVNAEEEGPFSGLISLGGNYDGQPVPVGIRGVVIPPPSEGEGEGEGEGEAGCPLLEGGQKRSMAGTSPLALALLLFLVAPRRLYRNK